MIKRIIVKNPLLGDGSPRRVKGYVTHLQLYTTSHIPNVRPAKSHICISEPLATRKEAESWFPNIYQITAIYEFAV